jgi:hypothetical protein|tara:strand:- start:335 stop:781 length:447 start_codon:yes stop_codon:yes gene_type:complete
VKKLPKNINYMGEDIVVSIRTMFEESDYGVYNDDFKQIVINSNKDPVEQLDALVHELGHVVEESMINEGWIKRAINHEFIDRYASALVIILGKAGLIKGITKDVAVNYEKVIAKQYLEQLSKRIKSGYLPNRTGPDNLGRTKCKKHKP